MRPWTAARKEEWEDKNWKALEGTETGEGDPTTGGCGHSRKEGQAGR